MPKSKSKSKANARAASQKRRSGRGLDAVAQFYSGSSDTFRFPDSSTTPTALMRLPEEQYVTGNATGGDAAVGFNTSLISSYSVNTVTAGNLAATYTTTAHPQQTVLSGNSSRARMTGWRITVRYIGPEQTCSGMMYVGSCVTFPFSTSLASLTPNMHGYALRPGGEWSFYSPMYDKPDFIVPTQSIWMNDYFGSLFFIFRGMPASSQCIEILSVRSVEYIPEISSAILCNVVMEPFDPVGVEEAGILSGTAQSNDNDSGPGWTEKVSDAIGNVMRGTTRAVVEEARNAIRDAFMAPGRQIVEF